MNYYSTEEDIVDNCLNTGTLDEWSQPEVKISSTKKSDEKSRKAVEETVDDFGGLDWSRPLVEPSVKVFHFRWFLIPFKKYAFLVVINGTYKWTN